MLFEKGLTVSKNPAVQSSLYRKAWVNSDALLDLYFMQEKRRRLCHAPFALRKSWIEEIEYHFPFVFLENSSHRFRSASNFNVTNGLFQYIWKYQEKVIVGALTNQMVSLRDDSAFDETQKALEDLIRSPKDTFCLQDCMLGQSDRTCQFLKTILQTLFPDPAPWESVQDITEKDLLEEAI